MRRIGLRQCIRPVGEALASGHDVLRALFDLTSLSAHRDVVAVQLRESDAEVWAYLTMSIKFEAAA
jgi:hypothetical protein